MSEVEALDDIDAAIADAEEAVRLDRRSAAAHAALGTALLEKGRLRAAEQALTAAVECDPTNADACNKLVSAQLRRGNIEAVTPALEDAARRELEDTAWEIDLLRYVRGAAWGFATWPLIVLFAGAGIVGVIDHEDDTGLVVGVCLLLLAPALLAARRRRWARFSPAVRAWVSRRNVDPDRLRPLDGPRTPWWWEIALRRLRREFWAVLFSSAAAYNLVYGALGGDGAVGHAVYGVVMTCVAVPLWMSVVSRYRAARRPHPLYSD